MIYLFNSAYRHLYTSNILNTMFYPIGINNEYRYSMTGDVRHVPPGFIDIINNTQPGEDVAIIFVDRFATGRYQYLPIRNGKFVGYWEENQRLFICVELSNYVFPRDLNRFNAETFHPLITEGCPKLSNNDPANTHDGFYILKYQNIFKPESEYYWGDEAWSNAVKALAGTTAFSTTEDDKNFVFVRAEIQNQDGKMLFPKCPKKGDPRFNIIRKKQYVLLLTYRFPVQQADIQKVTNLNIKVDDSAYRLLDNAPVPVDSIANSIKVSFTTKKYVEETNGKFTFEYEKDVIGPSGSIELNVVEDRSFWPQVLGIAVLYTISAVMISVESASPLTFSTFLTSNWLKLIFALAQAGILFWMIRLFGKKIL